MVASQSLVDIPSSGNKIEKHPVAYYYLAHLGLMLFDQGEFALRLPAALCGVISVPAMWLLARRTMEGPESLLATALFAVSSLHVLLSHEARSYTLVILFLCIATTAWIDALDSSPPSEKLWGVWVGAGTLAVYSHYLAFIVLGCQWIWALKTQAKTKIWWRTLPVVLVLYLPAMPRLLAQLGAPARGHSGPGLRSIFDAFYVQGFGFTLNFSALYQYYTLAAISLLLLALSYKAPRLRPLAAVYGLTLCGIFLLGLVSQVYQAKYFSLLSPLFFLLLAGGIFRIPSIPIRAALIALYLALNLTSALNSLAFSEWHPQDFRSAGEYLEQKLTPGDVVLIEPDWALPALMFYLNPHTQNVRLIPLSDSDSRGYTESNSPRNDRVWLVRAALAPRDSRVRQVLAQNTKPTSRKRFRKRNRMFDIEVLLFVR